MKQKAEQPDQPPTGKSRLAQLLMDKWAWGTMSAPMLQSIAQAAVQDGLQHPDVEKLAKIGGQGRFPGNMHRDLTLLAGKPTLSNAISYYRLKLKRTKTAVEDMLVAFLLPHKMFSCIYHTIPSAFKDSVLGGDPARVQEFWTSMGEHPFLVARPEVRSREDLHMLVPIGLHGDGVRYMQATRAGGKTLEVLSWCSLLTRGPTKVSSFLMLLIVKSCIKETGWDTTWPKAWRILCWSLTALASGKWPLKDWNNREFSDKESVDFLQRGQPLAGGFAAIVFVLKCDLKFLCNHFHLNNPASNTPCALCRAERTMDVPWTDCRACAAWRGTTWTAATWAVENPTAHQLFRMPGGGLDLVYPDLMHCKHLGTDQVLLGSVITWMIKSYLGGTIAENLDLLWSFIQAWFNDRVI